MSNLSSSPAVSVPENGFTSVFHQRLADIYPDDPDAVHCAFCYLKEYEESRDLPSLVESLCDLVKHPEHLKLFEAVRPLISVNHQIEYDLLLPFNSHVRKVVIKKNPLTGFGFHVRGGSEFNCGIFVSHVESGTAAERAYLFSGDRIVKCNNFNIKSALLFDFCKYIQLHSTIVLEVTNNSLLPFRPHHGSDISWLLTENNNRCKKSPIFTCMAYICGNGFGCSLAKHKHKPGIYAEQVVPFSVAHELGIRDSDLMLSVNGIVFQQISRTDAIMAFKRHNPVKIMFRKLTPGVSLPDFSAPVCPLAIRSSIEGDLDATLEEFRQEMESDSSFLAELKPQAQSSVEQSSEESTHDHVIHPQNNFQHYSQEDAPEMLFARKINHAYSNGTDEADYTLTQVTKGKVSRTPSKLVSDVVARIEAKNLVGSEKHGLDGNNENGHDDWDYRDKPKSKLTKSKEVLRRTTSGKIAPMGPMQPVSLSTHENGSSEPSNATVSTRIPARVESFKEPNSVAISSPASTDKSRTVSVTCNGYLGISLEERFGPTRGKFTVSCVEWGSPLRGCVRVGDRVTSVDGMDVSVFSLQQLNDVIRRIERRTGGSTIEIGVCGPNAQSPEEETTHF